MGMPDQPDVSGEKDKLLLQHGKHTHLVSVAVFTALGEDLSLTLAVGLKDRRWCDQPLRVCVVHGLTSERMVHFALRDLGNLEVPRRSNPLLPSRARGTASV